MSGNNIGSTMKKRYTAPSALIVALCLREGLLTSGSPVVGLSDGDAVADRQATVDSGDNQFVKSRNQWDDEW
jgi:hypothetical protein